MNENLLPQTEAEAKAALEAIYTNTVGTINSSNSASRAGMNEYLVFETKEAAQAALEVIYANMVGAINSPDLENVTTGEVVDKDDLTPEEVVEIDADQRHFPIFGVNAATGAKDHDDGYTTAWAVAQQTVQGKWVFPKPTDELMDGLEGYTVTEFNQDWFPSVQTNV